MHALAISVVTALALVGAGGCSKSETPPGEEMTIPGIPDDSTSITQPDGDFIGVTVPWLESENWTQAFEQFPAAIEAAGLAASMANAAQYVDRQVEQIELFTEWGAKVIVVGAVDGSGLTDVLKKARDAGILVLAYDGWGGDAEAVDGVVQFEAVEAGRVWAQTLLDGLEENAPPWTVELFAGDPESSSEGLTYAAAMDVLGPLIDDGTVVVNSGEVMFEDTSSQYLDLIPARERMTRLLTDHYPDKGPDGVLAPNSVFAQGIVEAFQDKGRPLPFLVNRGADDGALEQIRQGTVSATLAWPTSTLIERTMTVITAVLSGSGLPEPDTSLADAGKEVGVYAAPPLVITKANVDDVSPE